MKVHLLLLACFFSSLAFSQDNILLIIADDLGVDNVGIYAENSNAASTPNIDALASAGVMFRNAWSNPVCSPTRATIYTGRHGFRTGIGAVVTTASTTVLDLDEFTIAEALSQSHSNALIGKWHVGNDLNGGESGPNLAGWDYYAGLLTGALSDYYSWPRTVQGVTNDIQTYATTAHIDDAINWISEQNEPWFCILAFTAPHSPFHEPPAELHQVDLAGLDVNSDPLPFYKAAIEAMDTEIGRLITALGSELEQTNIIFIGDNGTPRQVVEDPITPDKSKGTVYEGGINVPMIVSGPAVAGSGREISAVAHTVDLYATIVELAGLDLSSTVPQGTVLDSVSLVPLIGSFERQDQRFIYAETFDDETDLAAARGRRYKLIRSFTDEQFFDLESDPYETQNLLETTLSTSQERAYQNLKSFLDEQVP